MKKILGLDLGTNSIGWAVVNAEQTEDNNCKLVGIQSSGSRIIPMDAALLGDFDRGNSISQTAERTRLRGVRRLLERSLLRRERLHRVLDILGFLPEHYSQSLNRYGKIIEGTEPKLPWRKNIEGKYEFLFIDSFNEMLQDFISLYPEFAGKKIPYDWTIYYLRKKALNQKIAKEELAWILLNFNQKRGYYQLRGEEEQQVDRSKEVKYYALKVLKVEATNDKKGEDTWYNVYLENGMIYRRSSKVFLDWEGKIKEFIVTTDLKEDGMPKTDKEGNVKRSFRAPKEDDWGLLKVKTESDISDSGKTVGQYIYESLLHKPDQKIIGKLVRTIERKFYKEELRFILEKQKEFIEELRDRDLYEKCINELYPINEAHRNNIENRDFTYLFIEDILFYQRPLKSKKHLISDCPYESYLYNAVDKDGKERVCIQGIKCIPSSHPLYQEFRLWQFVQNLRIYQKEKVVNGKLHTDVDVTSEFFQTEDDIVTLFDWLNDRSSIKQETLFTSYFKLKKKKNEVCPYRWNYVEDKEYPCNETRSVILKGLNNINVKNDFLDKERETAIWHMLYSIEDKVEIEKALTKYAKRIPKLPDSFAEELSKIKPFKKDYGSYSAKAIKKLLPLMRMGKYWDADAIDIKTKERIEKLIDGEYDENISDRVREKVNTLNDLSQYRGLPIWVSCYVVYNRHSEAKDIAKWEKPEDIDTYLRDFKQHSLRNPIVEQIVTETLRTVRDIWKQEGQIDEIHLELGREMKSPADKRKQMTERILENENTNLRIKTILAELKNPEYEVDNVRPYSPSQQDILKIYEEYALDNLTKDDKEYEFVKKISKSAQPTKSEIIKYKAWLEQKYRSPYTGETIPLSKLFTEAYEIEHVIPQSRYFDDSFSNKVICESEVNKLKDRMLGYEFIKNHHGEKVQLSGGRVVEILQTDVYEQLVKSSFSGPKKNKLLMEDIPDGFIERQLNDSRYISKFIKGLLSNIVREKDANGIYEQEAISKNLITCTGSVTDRLKKDWGLNDVWNAIVLPRFQRLNQLTGQDCFTTLSKEGHLIPNMPLEFQKGFNKKRIDHRHHAMDAIVIACATREHVNLLNNEAAHSKHNANRYQLQRKLRKFETEIIKGEEREIAKEFIKPWGTFTTDVFHALQNIIISFKQNLRIINKATNVFAHFEDGKKKRAKQAGTNWAIRKTMHDKTFWAKVKIRKTKNVMLNSAIQNVQMVVDKELKCKLKQLLQAGKTEKQIRSYFEKEKDIWSDINLNSIEIYYFELNTATRFLSDLTTLFSSIKYDVNAKDKVCAEVQKKIEHITDTGIQKILEKHFKACGLNPEIAFSAEGIDILNKNIILYNNGKRHCPIYKVRRYEGFGRRFPLGQKGAKMTKYVETAANTNLYFAVYETELFDASSGNLLKKRNFATIPLNVVIERLKQGLSPAPADENGNEPLFVLSPNDLVYVPDDNNVFDPQRIYKMTDSSETTANFIPATVANIIYHLKKVDATKFCKCKKVIQNEFGLGSPQSKNQRAITNEMIKEVCIPIKVDRLGNITKMGY